MPLVAHNALPTFQRLRDEGQRILSPERASEQDIRGLHVGILNMMPDAALAATERQFFRLVGSSNPISQFYIHPFTLDAIPRSASARARIVSAEIFWEPLCEVLEWADQHVTSTLCSCLATHAVLLARYGIQRQSLESKCWGVFEHEVQRQDHPLVSDVNRARRAAGCQSGWFSHCFLSGPP